MTAKGLTPTLQVKEYAKVKRIRELPVKGEIIKGVGSQVTSTDIVAKTILQGELYILKIAEKMGLTPEEISSKIKIKIGDSIKEGELLCSYSALFGIFKNQYHSPFSGIVELIQDQTGHIGIRTEAESLEVDAYISGTVVYIDPEKSITIEADAALVQGVFGVGGERKGKICFLNMPRDKPVQKEDIPRDISAQIIIGGSYFTKEAIHLATQRGAIGIVTGSIDDLTLTNYLGYELGIALTGNEKVPATLIITEGFGQLAMSERAYTLLKKYHDKVASINGATQVRAGAIRPEVIICHTDLKNIPASEEEDPYRLTVGRKIRIIRTPYFGQEAEVTDLPNNLVQIETGAFARVLEAKLADGKTVRVPRANVELV